MEKRGRKSRVDSYIRFKHPCGKEKYILGILGNLYGINSHAHISLDLLANLC